MRPEQPSGRLTLQPTRPAAATSEFWSPFMDSLQAEVQEIFREVFDKPDLVITRESKASTVDDWDSLAHINLVMAIERKYKIRFALGQLKELENVGDLLDLLRTKISAR